MNFNAREIFDIGVQIEANGKAFYEAAAKKTAETATREFFLELAAWEGTHIKLFGELRDALPRRRQRPCSIRTTRRRSTCRRRRTATCS